MKTEREAALFDPDSVGNHRVSGSGPQTFADAIRQPDSKHLRPRLSKGEERSYEGGDGVTGNDEGFSFSESVA